MSCYRTLDSQETVSTLAILCRRIQERFPDSGLQGVCGELLQLSREAGERAADIARPNLWVRAGAAFVIIAMIAILGYSLTLLDYSVERFTITDLVTLSEAAINDLVLIGAAIFFLVTAESRIKRERALAALHELRAIAHVIDMHQLTKDPSRDSGHDPSHDTPSSPTRDMDAFELMRYLDYCSEMLSLTGKVAAGYAQNLPDAVVVAAVNDVENLCTGLSRKIWQKIMILKDLERDEVDR